MQNPDPRGGRAPAARRIHSAAPLLLAAPLQLVGPPHLAAPPQLAATPSWAAAVTDDPSPRERRALVLELERALRSRHANERRRAVERAGGLGGDEGLDLVMVGLADERGQVADTAQDVLAGMPADLVVPRLTGRDGLRSRDDWVRVRAAEVLGALPCPGEDGLRPRDIARGIDLRAPRVALATLRAIEARARRTAGPCAIDAEARRELAGEIEAALRPRVDDRVRARALCALSVLDPAAARGALEEVGGRAGVRTRAAVLRAARAASAPHARDLHARALEDEAPSVRAAALDLIAEGHADRALLVRAAGLLDADPRPAVRDRAARTLALATGLTFGDHARSWVHALERLPDGWTPEDGRRERERRLAEEAGREVSTATSRLGALTPRSDHLAVLVDFSGSLWSERPDGTCRKDALDPEVAEFLGRLDGDTSFLVLPFTHELHPLTDAPVRATERAVAAARRDFAAARWSGRGDVFAAIERALEHEEIDRIVLVTDGAPTGGRRWDVERMIDLLLERQRFRPIAYDVVLGGAPKRLVARWRRLTEASGGRLVVVD